MKISLNKISISLIPPNFGENEILGFGRKQEE
jgi:hypothetical protein